MNIDYPNGFKEVSIDGDLFLNLNENFFRLIYSEETQRKHCLFSEVLLFCRVNKLPFVITSTIRDKMPWSKTDIHSDGRAIDVSVHRWPADMIDFFTRTMNSIFSKQIGAFGLESLVPHAVIYEVRPGVEPHFHIQVRRGT